MSEVISASARSTATRSTSKRQGEMSDFDKGRIVGWHDEGVSKREIGRRLGWNKSTIRNFLKWYVKSKSIQNETNIASNSGMRTMIKTRTMLYGVAGLLKLQNQWAIRS